MRIIDGDALIKDIDYSADMGGALGKVVECVKYYAKYTVASAPTIEPERKKGKWIRLTNDLAQCSECEDYIDNAISCGYNYCPNCGAEMSE